MAGSLINLIKSPNVNHYFSADRPIERLDEDRLQRRSFAQSIAQAITTWSGDESLVMALYGGWGDGKTSVKGMVVDAMRMNPATCPFIVHFNPWEWAGQNQLAQVFFDEIGKQIAHQGEGQEKKKAEECSRRLRTLGKYLTLTGSLVTPVMSAASLAFPVVSIFTPAVSKVFKKSGKLAKQAAEAVQEQAEREDVNLLTVKLELKKALIALKRNIVVLVDDIDRLAADEIKLLFQLIKANSDFPNLIFFLFFQRDIIESALGRTIRTGTGKEYLEKIVQVPLSLPHIQRPLLEDLIESKLRDVLTRRGLDGTFDWSRFKELWRQALNGYFHNVRDAARFFSTFEFQVASFPDPAEFNPIDLFALEVLRTFEGSVYETLPRSRHLLTQDADAQPQADVRDLDVTIHWQKGLKQIVTAGKANKPEATEAILRELFPFESFMLGLKTPASMIRFQKETRVCHPAFFGRYFHLCIPQGDIPQSEILKLMKAIPRPSEFKRLLLDLDNQHLALEALTRLSAYGDDFDSKDSAQIAGALYDEGDVLVGRYDDSLWNGYSAMSSLLIEAHLDKLGTVAERFAVLKQVFERTKGIYLPVRQLLREGSRANEFKTLPKSVGLSSEQYRVLEVMQLEELAAICVRHVEQTAASGALLSHPKLKELLDVWLRWGGPSKPAEAWFRKMVATDDGLLTLLENFLGSKLSEDFRQKFINRLYDEGLTKLEQFMPAEDIKRRVKELSQKKFSEFHTKLCKLFLDVYAEHIRDRQ